MKTIQLTQNKEASVDEEDFTFLSKFKWHAFHDNRHDLWYASSKRLGLMHRVLLHPSPDQHVDHVDHNGLNNQKSNLRICTISQNQQNRLTTPGTSRYKGVSWDSQRCIWRAEIVHDFKRHRIGRFESENEAACAYNEKAIELFGIFAKLNVILKHDRFVPDDYEVRPQTRSSNHKGVSFDKSRSKWMSYIHVQGKKIKLGRFESESAAIHAQIDYYDHLPEHAWFPG